MTSQRIPTVEIGPFEILAEGRHSQGRLHETNEYSITFQVPSLR